MLNYYFKIKDVYIKQKVLTDAHNYDGVLKLECL